MTTTTTTPTRIDRSTAEQVGTAVYDDLLALLHALEPADWRAPTDCDRWDVAAMVGHLIGAARSHVRKRELARQQWYGRRHADEFGGSALDAVNDLQVREHAHLSPEERVEVLASLARPAVHGRMTLPGPLRRVRLKMPIAGDTPVGTPPSFTLGHLNDVVLTRDVWLHRVDIARATGRDLPLSDVDGTVVEDVVGEWFQVHGRPVTVELGGPAGGRWQQGDGGPRIAMDAVEFCRALSGRAPADGLLTRRVMF